MGASRVIVQGLRPRLLMFKSVANDGVTSERKAKTSGLWEDLGTDVWSSLASQAAILPFVAGLILLHTTIRLLLLHK